MSRLPSFKLVIAGFLLATGLASGVAQAKGPVFFETQATVAVGELPRQGVQTYELIHQGACVSQARSPDACYYTADHYASFRKIVP